MKFLSKLSKVLKKNEKLKENFVCRYEKCNKYFDEPVLLECGQTVCKSHTEHILRPENIENGAYFCSFCRARHSVKEFILNHHLSNLMSEDFHLPNIQKEIKKSFFEYEKTVQKIKNIIEDPCTYRYDFISELKRKVDLQREELKEIIDELHLDLIDKIDKLYIHNKTLDLNLETFTLKNYDDLIYYKDYIRIPYIESNDFEKKLEILNKKKDESKDLLFEIEKKIFNGAHCKFQEPPKIFSISSFCTLRYEREVELKSIRILTGHTKPVTKVLFKSDYMISRSNDGSIKLWNLETGYCLKTLFEHPISISSMCLLSKNRLACYSVDKILRIWHLDTNNSKSYDIPKTTSQITCMAANKTCLFLGTVDSYISVWSTGDFKPKYNMQTNLKGRVTNLLLINEEVLACTCEDNTILLLRTAVIQPIITKLKEHTDMITCLKLMNNGNLLSASQDKTIKIWDKDDEFKCMKSLAIDEVYNHLDILNDNQILVFCESKIQPKLKLINLNDQNECCSVFRIPNCSHISILPNCDIAVCIDNVIKLINIQ